MMKFDEVEKISVPRIVSRDCIAHCVNKDEMNLHDRELFSGNY